MSRRCIFAYTVSDENYYPAYVSINREEDGKLTITVRAPRREPGTPDNAMSFALPGREATITVPEDQAGLLATGIIEEQRHHSLDAKAASHE